jgi:hypothetical protein
MKKLIIALFALTSFAIGQDRPKNEIYVGFEAARDQVEFRGQNFEYKPGNDSFGFRGEYVRKVTPVIGIGMKAGVTFHNEDTDEIVSCGTGCTIDRNGISKVANAHASYFVRFQAPKGGVRPFVDVHAGASRENFGGMVFVSGKGIVGSKNSFTYGAGGGVDFGKGKVAFRVGVDYLNTAGNEGRRHNLQLHLGPVFRF